MSDHRDQVRSQWEIGSDNAVAYLITTNTTAQSVIPERNVSSSNFIASHSEDF